MDEARRVLRRLQRIELLEREGASAAALLVEVRALLGEAEAWVRCERDEGVEDALARCRAALLRAGASPETTSAVPLLEEGSAMAAR